MRIHFIQHVPFENPGSIIHWAKENGHVVSFTKVFEFDGFPALHDFDLLIVLGGPMALYEQDKYDWMSLEKIFIKSVIDAGKKVLGICLGAQFVAEALAAKVYPHSLKETGWWPVQKVNEHELSQHLPDEFTAFHWHGDTFDLPEGAIQLFRTTGCEQQGFVYNNHAAGLQFHLEVIEDLLHSMIEYERAELIRAQYVQSEDEILEKAKVHLAEQKDYIGEFIESFVKL